MTRLAVPVALLLALGLFLPVAVGAPPEKDDVLSVVDEVLKEVEKIRGLEFKEPVKREIMTPEDIGRIVREKIAAEIPPEKLAGMNLLLVRMGYMRSGTKLEDCFEAFLQAGAAGLYVPEKKTLYIMEGFSVKGAKPIIFHELVHALEDQHYGLDKRMSAVMNDSDRALGLQGLVEGSAQHMMGKYLRKYPALMHAMMADAGKQAGAQAELINNTPIALFAGSAFFPYFNGPSFVYHVTKDDAAKIGSIYADMPVSSEQVLHPEKYGINGDFPHTVRIAGVDKAVPEGWKFVNEDSIGELQVGFLLNEFEGGPQLKKLMRVVDRTQKIVFRGTTKKASEGWDGDWIKAWRGPKGECGFVWASQWDSDQDAAEFHDAYRTAIPYKWNELGLLPATARMEVRGSRVLIVEGFPEDALREIAAAAWAGATFVPDARDKLDSPRKR